MKIKFILHSRPTSDEFRSWWLNTIFWNLQYMRNEIKFYLTFEKLQSMKYSSKNMDAIFT